jgi:AraC family transcriptional regulator
MILHIENMLSSRSITVVKQQLETLGFYVTDVTLGKTTITPDANEIQLLEIACLLRLSGFELSANETQNLVEQIKNVTIAKLNDTDLSGLVCLSRQLTSLFNKKFAELNQVFLKHEGVTIEQFFIQRKSEKFSSLSKYNLFNIN